MVQEQAKNKIARRTPGDVLEIVQFEADPCQQSDSRTFVQRNSSFTALGDIGHEVVVRGAPYVRHSFQAGGKRSDVSVERYVSAQPPSTTPVTNIKLFITFRPRRLFVGRESSVMKHDPPYGSFWLYQKRLEYKSRSLVQEPDR